MTRTTGRLDPATYLAHLREEGDRLAQAALGADLDAPVPGCPGWSVRDAVVHTGEVFEHKTATMRLDEFPGEGEWELGPPEGPDPVGWFRGALDRLVDELVRQGADSPSPTWLAEAPRATTAFWYRRMAQEVAVHRVDVESARGEARPVDATLAADGIDEVLEWFLSGDWSDTGQHPGEGEVVAVRTGAEVWLVTLDPARVGLDRAPGASDAVVSGGPSQMLLWLWGRCPDTAVQVEGDPAAVAALRRALVVCTQ